MGSYMGSRLRRAAFGAALVIAMCGVVAGVAVLPLRLPSPDADGSDSAPIRARGAVGSVAVQTQAETPAAEPGTPSPASPVSAAPAPATPSALETLAAAASSDRARAPRTSARRRTRRR